MTEFAGALVTVMTEDEKGHRRVYAATFINHGATITVHTSKGDDYEIVDGRCSCPAAKKGMRCRHLLLLEVVRRVHMQERALK